MAPLRTEGGDTLVHQSAAPDGAPIAREAPTGESAATISKDNTLPGFTQSQSGFYALLEL